MEEVMILITTYKVVIDWILLVVVTLSLVYGISVTGSDEQEARNTFVFGGIIAALSFAFGAMPVWALYGVIGITLIAGYIRNN